MEPLDWTLDDLSRRVETALARLGPELGQHNGQVSEVPNARTIRYYTTIGLLDRPRSSGRTAMYRRRHLEQLVAIKRLQARGLTLVQVQERLLGLDDAALTALAGLPDDPAWVADTSGSLPADESRRTQSFWSAQPSAPAATKNSAGTNPSAAGLARATPRSRTAPAARSAAGLQLEDGVTLAFPAARPIRQDDLEALREALRPLVDTLRARGLIALALKEEEP